MNDRPNTFEEKLDARGFASTRVSKLKWAVEQLHGAICQMDTQNKALFEEVYGGEFGIYQLLYDYSEAEHGLFDIFPQSTNELSPNID
tara:strand:+ start:264 stop:527 length:264 start_codon:yes stop_codon:yes gene_type:complete